MAGDNQNRSRFTIPGVDQMRASVGASTSSLANASNTSWEVVSSILKEERKPKTSCERVINGLKKLGHPTASYDDIIEHLD
jgi:hypothetical protein